MTLRFDPKKIEVNLSEQKGFTEGKRFAVCLVDKGLHSGGCFRKRTCGPLANILLGRLEDVPGAAMRCTLFFFVCVG